MLSDIENLDIRLGVNNFLEREESESRNFGRKPDSPCYDTSVNQNTKSHSKSREAQIRTCALNGRNFRETESNSEFNKLSGELNQRITRAMGDFMSTVSTQIQRDINEAISDQVLSDIQATLRHGEGEMPERR